MLSVGALIFVALRPLIKIMLCVLGGFIITKADIFPPVASRGAGQIALNITMPCLMFSKIVPAFSSSNIGVLGPLVVIAAIYQAMGIVIAWLVKQVFWVPHRFRYGIIVAGGWGNYGDLPTAVIMSITGSSPFKGESDQNLSVAYISALILFYMITFFPLGGNRWIAMDYKGPDVEPEEVQAAMRIKRKRMVQAVSRIVGRKGFKAEDSEHGVDSFEKCTEEPLPKEEATFDSSIIRPIAQRHVSFADGGSTVVPTECPTRPSSTTGPITEEKLHKVSSPAPTVTDTLYQNGTASRPMTPISETSSITRPAKTFSRRAIVLFKNFLRSLCMPASLAIIISFPIALINPLKALFVTVDGYYMPSAPDGEPPLAVLYDFAEFMGAASVPLNLVCLGSALARLNVPRSQWPRLPLGAIFSMAVGRMLLMPVLGVLICQGLIHVNFISKDDKVLQFVCIFFSCLPTATTQVFVTQVYSGTGEAEHLSAFLIPQYILMFVSMTVLSAYTLQLLF